MPDTRQPDQERPAGRRSFIVGTAGHIDHGKSALVRELTGTDPDRWREEKERGITIDLGFAHLDLADLRVAFIDVPGHERFVKNMLAGVGGIDAVLLVVAADESVKPQTREHLAICRLLGIDSGLVAISKCDLVDSEIVDLVELEVRELVADSFLADADIVRTSVATGAGLDHLRAALERLLSDRAGRPSDGIARLPVDRVFSVRGFGTVVTGTLISGIVHTGDSLELLPAARRVAVRGIQVHDEARRTAEAGQRTALNLQGIAVGDVRRGDVLVTAGTLTPTRLIDARLHMLEDLGGLEHLQRVRFHHGAAELLGRVALLEGDAIVPGDSALVQLRLERRYAVAPGDRFIIRRYSPMVTIGGGVVIDAMPGKHRRADTVAVARLQRLEQADATGAIVIWAAEAGDRGLSGPTAQARLAVSAGRLRQLVDGGVARGDLVVVRAEPLLVIAAATSESLRARLLALVEQFHEREPLRPATPKNQLRAELPRAEEAVLEHSIGSLVEDGLLRRVEDGLAAATHRVELDSDQARLRTELLRRFEAGGLAPPGIGEAVSAIGVGVAEANDVLHHMLREGELVRLRDDLLFHAGRLQGMIDALRQRYARGEKFSVGEFKEWAGISRKHAIPLLEHLDQLRVTRRVGDSRERL